MEILKRVIKKSLVTVLPAAVVSGFFEWKKLPLSIIAGGLLGILNLRGLVRSVEGFVDSEKPTAKVILLSMTRLLFLFAAILVLLKLGVVNIFGIILGLTIIFALILIEGRKVGTPR